MSEQLVTLEIDGKTVQAPKGSMIIEAADAVGIPIARFCYHKHLSIAANCRMCLVEAEKFNKPLPACATPVAEGMKVWTHSERAKEAQQAIMRFLLINHPLDCPICDQGGECDLQDQAMSHGNSHSTYQEIKRVMPDQDIGPLIETAMTRCIQCTRCVRFGDEIAGLRELGGLGRGDRLAISTYVKQALRSELSGNIIDLCPVGALTAKPSRYTARPWEMVAHESIAPHDAVGSNVQVHTFKGEVVRVVPRENPAINECWISDRDRFSYQALRHEERLLQPMLKQHGKWVSVSWTQALKATADILQSVEPEKTCALASASSTLEELFLFQKLMRAMDVKHIDHRLRQVDFFDQVEAPRVPWLGMSIAKLQEQQSFILIGSHVRYEQPLLNHRIRQATRFGARVLAINPRVLDFNYPVEQHIIPPIHLVETLAGVVQLLADKYQKQLTQAEQAICIGIPVTETAQRLAKALDEHRRQESVVLLGNWVIQYPTFSAVRALSTLLAELLNASLGYLPERSNTIGAAIAGVVPHHGVLGSQVKKGGMAISEALNSNMEAYVLMNIEPEFDSYNPTHLLSALQAAENVIAMTPFVNETMRHYASVLLPCAAWTETAGTYVNAELSWQRFQGVVAPPGEARPAWKILRVLGNQLALDEFDYMNSEEISAELRLLAMETDSFGEMSYKVRKDFHVDTTWQGMQRIGDTDPYRMDNLVRRAKALQQLVPSAAVHIHPEDAQALAVEEGDMLRVVQDIAVVQLPVTLDASIPRQCAWVASGTEIAACLGGAFSTIHLEKA